MLTLKHENGRNTKGYKNLFKKSGAALISVLIVMSLLVMLASALFFTVVSEKEEVFEDARSEQLYQSAVAVNDWLFNYLERYVSLIPEGYYLHGIKDPLVYDIMSMKPTGFTASEWTALGTDGRLGIVHEKVYITTDPDGTALAGDADEVDESYMGNYTIEISLVQHYCECTPLTDDILGKHMGDPSNGVPNTMADCLAPVKIFEIETTVSRDFDQQTFVRIMEYRGSSKEIMSVGEPGTANSSDDDGFFERPAYYRAQPGIASATSKWDALNIMGRTYFGGLTNPANENSTNITTFTDHTGFKYDLDSYGSLIIDGTADMMPGPNPPIIMNMWRDLEVKNVNFTQSNPFMRDGGILRVGGDFKTPRGIGGGMTTPANPTTVYGFGNVDIDSNFNETLQGDVAIFSAGNTIIHQNFASNARVYANGNITIGTPNAATIGSGILLSAKGDITLRTQDNSSQGIGANARLSSNGTVNINAYLNQNWEINSTGPSINVNKMTSSNLDNGIIYAIGLKEGWADIQVNRVGNNVTISAWGNVNVDGSVGSNVTIEAYGTINITGSVNSSTKLYARNINGESNAITYGSGTPDTEEEDTAVDENEFLAKKERLDEGLVKPVGWQFATHRMSKWNSATNSLEDDVLNCAEEIEHSMLLQYLKLMDAVGAFTGESKNRLGLPSDLIEAYKGGNGPGEEPWYEWDEGLNEWTGILSKWHRTAPADTSFPVEDVVIRYECYDGEECDNYPDCVEYAAPSGLTPVTPSNQNHIQTEHSQVDPLVPAKVQLRLSSGAVGVDYQSLKLNDANNGQAYVAAEKDYWFEPLWGPKWRPQTNPRTLLYPTYSDKFKSQGVDKSKGAELLASDYHQEVIDAMENNAIRIDAGAFGGTGLVTSFQRPATAADFEYGGGGSIGWNSAGRAMVITDSGFIGGAGNRTPGNSTIIIDTRYDENGNPVFNEPEKHKNIFILLKDNSPGMSGEFDWSTNGDLNPNSGLYTNIIVKGAGNVVFVMDRRTNPSCPPGVGHYADCRESGCNELVTNGSVNYPRNANTFIGHMAWIYEMKNAPPAFSAMSGLTAMSKITATSGTGMNQFSYRISNPPERGNGFLDHIKNNYIHKQNYGSADTHQPSCIVAGVSSNCHYCNPASLEPISDVPGEGGFGYNNMENKETGRWLLRQDDEVNLIKKHGRYYPSGAGPCGEAGCSLAICSVGGHARGTGMFIHNNIIFVDDWDNENSATRFHSIASIIFGYVYSPGSRNQVENTDDFYAHVIGGFLYGDMGNGGQQLRAMLPITHLMPADYYRGPVINGETRVQRDIISDMTAKALKGGAGSGGGESTGPSEKFYIEEVGKFTTIGYR
ncbi:MAG: hemagglutinin repeat-containing protein [Oscillospiraceae bacterium]|nr:hemagglutinin repeat-containing protein [Oscillospiraceae bacterium]